jgi:hypothetical protein
MLRIFMKIKTLIKGIPVVGPLAQKLNRKLQREAVVPVVPFRTSPDYWETRYAVGGNSGVGSYGKFSKFKAEVLNRFVEERAIQSVMEFGCGDGNQLGLAVYPRYSGYDVSKVAVETCRLRFANDSTKSFGLLDEYKGEQAELVLSLDVIYHLVEDDVFDRYMRSLFDAATHYVIIYSSNTDDNGGYDGSHVRHRMFTRWLPDNRPSWTLIQHIPNRYPYQGDYTQGSFADFYVYSKGTAGV